MGVTAPAPRPTPRAMWLVFRYLGAPLIGALVLFDVLVWLAGRALFDVCIGVWCWF